MRKYILLIAVLLAAAGMPTTMAYATEAPAVEVNIENDYDISTVGRDIRIRGAEGTVANIYSVTGRKVGSYNIDSPDKRITMPEKGCYIIKIGKVVRKVTIK